MRFGVDVLDVEEEHFRIGQQLFKRAPIHVAAGIDCGGNAARLQFVRHFSAEIGLQERLAAGKRHAARFAVEGRILERKR